MDNTQMMDGLVSIIIPTYKGYDTLGRSVKSVLEQSYKNIEIIIVDDNGEGSENQIKTEDVLKSFLVDERVKYIKHKKNLNGSAARNTGFRHSNGEFIAFLDDDDEFLYISIE